MREEHRCDAMRKSNSGGRRGNGVYGYGVVTMAAVVIVFQLCIDVTLAAPAAYDSLLPQSGEIAEYFSNNEYISGCYYNFQRYEEGDRIVTNEPCLNCTCHNRMLMCYLRVCPFTKAIGQDCTIEKKPDQCCPIITCPEVPVKLLTSSTTSSPTPTSQATEVGFHDNYGCSIDDSFYADGAQVPSDSKKPCELCYCIRNRTACVMQECTLHVEGCKPVYQDGICCPVRYDCDYEKEIMSTPRLQTSGGVIKSTTYASVVDCQYGNQSYSDGELITTDKPCEHCYCMRGDIVCAVQDCGEPLRGKDCVPTTPPPERCCPSSYECTNDSVSIPDSVTKGSNILNTEGLTTFEKSTPYPAHASSVLTPEEIYTKLGENKTPESANAIKPVNSSEVHPAEGIQTDSNNVDAGEHVFTTSDSVSSSHKDELSSATYPTPTPFDRYTTVADIHTTTFEKHPPGVELQSTVIVGDLPTTVQADYGSIGAVDVAANSTTASEIPGEQYTSVSTTSQEPIVTTLGYTKGSETTKYDSNEISEHETEKVTSYLEKSTESQPSNEISDESQSTKKPGEEEQKLPQDTTTKVPYESSPAETTYTVEYSTNTIHKIDSTTRESAVTDHESAVTETKNTISNKNTETVADSGAEQPTHNVIPDEPADDSVSQTERPSVISDEGEVKEPVQTTTSHYVDNSAVSTKEPVHGTVSSAPSGSEYSTESPTEPSAQTTTSFASSAGVDSTQPAANPTTIYPEASSSQNPASVVTTFEETNLPITTSHQGISENTEHVSYTQSPQTTVHHSSVDKTSYSEIQTNVPPPSEGADVLVDTTTTTYQQSPAEQDISTSSHTGEPADKGPAAAVDTLVPYTKQPTEETTHQAASSSGYETTTTYLSQTDGVSASAETNDLSTLSPQPSPPTLAPVDSSAVIPGEGSCLVDGLTYPNASVIESSNPCHKECTCLSSIPTCTLITCYDPHSNDPKCMPVQTKPESCCPVYVCSDDENPAGVPTILSDNHIAQTEVEIAPTTKYEQPTTTSEAAPIQPESAENSIDVREKPTTILPSGTTSAEPVHTSASTHGPDAIVADEAHETPNHDDDEISNEVSPGTEASVSPPAADSQLKNTSPATSLSIHDVESTAQPIELTSEKVNIPDEHINTGSDGVSSNDVITTTEQISSSSSSYHEHTYTVTEGEVSTDVQTETTTPSKTEPGENNEIGAPVSSPNEKDAVAVSQTSSSSSEVPSTSSPEVYTTFSPSIVSEDSSAAAPHTSSAGEYFETKTTTSEPYQNVKDESTSSLPEHSHEIYSTSSEYTTVIDDSNDIITAAPESPLAPSSSKQPSDILSSTLETTVKPESEPVHIETTTGAAADHSEDIVVPTTIVNEVYQTEIPSEEPSSSAAPVVENKFQEKISTPVPPTYETEPPIGVTTPSLATPESVSSEEPSESTSGGYETTVVAGASTLTTKQPTDEFTGYSTSVTQAEATSSTSVYQSTPPPAAITEHEVTEINTQPAASVVSSAETTAPAEYFDVKTTLAPSPHHHADNSSEPITTTASTYVSEGAAPPSGEPSHQPPSSSSSEAAPAAAEEEAAATTLAASTNIWSAVPEKVATLLNQTTSPAPTTVSAAAVTDAAPIQHSTWTRKPVDEEAPSSEPNYYPQPPMYPPGIETGGGGGVDGNPVEEYDEETGAFGPGTCRYAGKVYVSAQQIPRDDPCDFCFCFRSDIICLQQSCPPPIHGCRQEPIQGFCCPRYECPVTAYSGSHNSSLTASSTTTTSTTAAPARPPRYPFESYRSAARRTGCMLNGEFYNVGEEISIASGPCLECLCGSDGSMKCDPRVCSPEPEVRQTIIESK